MLRFRHDGFNAVADINDHLATLESLDEAVDQLSCLADVLIVYVVSFSFANFLKDDLLGGLSCNSAQILDRTRQFKHIADLCAFPDLCVGLIDRHFARRIDNLIHHDLDRVQLHGPGFGIVMSMQVFTRFELFSRSSDDSVLDRADYQLRIYFLLFAENVYVLCNRT